MTDFDNQARALLLDLAYQTDAQILRLARDIYDGTDIPGIVWVHPDIATLANRREFVSWLITRNADLLADKSDQKAVCTKIMTGAGFERYSTGGNCWAWQKHNPRFGSDILICTEGNECYGDPLATDWLVGHHSHGGTDDFEQLDDVVTLYDALILAQVFEFRPVPPDQVGIHLEDGLEEELLAQRWVNKLGLELDIDKDGRDYPRLSGLDERAAYDNDIHLLCRVSPQPQHAVERAWQRAGLLAGRSEHSADGLSRDQFLALKSGTRLRLRESLDLYPVGRFLAGITGTVSDISEGDVVIGLVTLDSLAWECSLKEWNNALQVNDPQRPDCGLCVPSSWEVVV